jgi:hypothetical protein
MRASSRVAFFPPWHSNYHPRGTQKKKNKGESVGCFCVGLRFFGLFCKNLLYVILTPPARYQHPHDANNPQVASRSLGQL